MEQQGKAKPPVHMSREVREQIASDYAAGVSIRALMKKYDRSYGGVHGVIVRAGGTFRPPGGHHNKNKPRKATRAEKDIARLV